MYPDLHFFGEMVCIYYTIPQENLDRARDTHSLEQVELFQSVDTDQSADVSEKEYDAWVDKQKEEQNKEYEKIASKARNEFMEQQIEALKTSNLAAEEKGEPLVHRRVSISRSVGA